MDSIDNPTPNKIFMCHYKIKMINISSLCWIFRGDFKYRIFFNRQRVEYR